MPREIGIDRVFEQLVLKFTSYGQARPARRFPTELPRVIGNADVGPHGLMTLCPRPGRIARP
jgi:hypothetical protein